MFEPSPVIAAPLIASGPLGTASDRRPIPPAPRRYRSVNWIGLKTLYVREVRRFMKVAVQTVFAPIVSTLLFMVVFSVALGQRPSPFAGVAYTSFLAPGLILMGALNNAFANSSSSLQIAKVQGTTIDFLMPPLSAWELTAGFLGGAATRGVIVALVSAAICAPFAALNISHLWAVLYYAIAASLMMGAIGVIGGVWAEKFDHLAAFTGFVITPMTFLSGTFYSLDRLPPLLKTISHLNPVFLLIDGFRYGFVGRSDGPLAIGALATALLTTVLVLLAYSVFARGWKLKA